MLTVLSFRKSLLDGDLGLGIALLALARKSACACPGGARGALADRQGRWSVNRRRYWT